MKDYRSSIEKKIVDTVHPYKIYENKRIPGQWATYIYDRFRKGKRRNIRRRNYDELIEHNPIHDVDFKRLPFKPVPDKQEDIFTREEAYKLLTYAYNGENLPQLSRMMGHSQVSTTLHYLRNVDKENTFAEVFKNLGNSH